MTRTDEPELVQVTDLKQWAYCPRIVYYRRTLGLIGHPTYKMQEGKLAQAMVEGLELRRGLKRYGLEGARRRFGLWLSDSVLGLAGRIDMLVTDERTGVVVDFKLTAGEPHENHLLQLVGYAVLVESVLKLVVPVCFFYRIPDARLFEVPVTAELRRKVEACVGEIRDLAARQWCPEPTPVRSRCGECEYVNLCGDVW